MAQSLSRRLRAEEPTVPYRRRRRARWQTALGLLLILAVLLAVADRVAAAVAADQMDTRMGAELQARGVGYASLDTGVTGMPFLTQVAQGRYEGVTIDMTEVRLQSDGREATLPALHILATGVRADAMELMNGDAQVTAEQVVGTGVVSYSGLTQLVDLSGYFVGDVVFTEQDGALYASGTLAVAGLEIDISAGAELTLQDGQIQLRFRDASAVGMTVPDAALPLLDRLVNAVIVAYLPPLPFDITVDALDITPDGVAITASGREVSLVTPRQN